MGLKLFLFAEKNIDDLKKELEVNDHRLSPEELYKKYQVYLRKKFNFEEKQCLNNAFR